MADYSFEDYGFEGGGIIHRYICKECGAEIEVSERLDEPREDKQADERQMTWSEYEDRTN